MRAPTTWQTVAEVAAALGICEKTVRRMVTRGELPHRRCGRLVRIPSTALEPATEVVPLRSLR